MNNHRFFIVIVFILLVSLLQNGCTLFYSVKKFSIIDNKSDTFSIFENNNIMVNYSNDDDGVNSSIYISNKSGNQIRVDSVICIQSYQGVDITQEKFIEVLEPHNLVKRAINTYSFPILLCSKSEETSCDHTYLYFQINKKIDDFSNGDIIKINIRIIYSINDVQYMFKKEFFKKCGVFRGMYMP